MTRPARILARLTLVAVCLVYVFWDVDLAALGRALASFRLWGLLALGLVMWASFLLAGARLSWLMRRKAGSWSCFNAYVLGLGLSNVLPAKGGELAKALHLRREAGLPLSHTVSTVFWERFLDLNALTLLGAGAAAFLGHSTVAAGLATATAVLWTLIILVRHFPSLPRHLSSIMVWQRLKDFFQETAAQAAGGLHPGYLGLGAVLSVPVWLTYYLQYHILLNLAAGFGLAHGAVIAVFLIGVLGLAAPSTPGGLGVYEAVLVAALQLHDIDKESAVAAGLAYRFFQFAPPTLYALALLAVKGLPLGRMSVKPDPGA
jgi:uncharacterized membrane protein YbhN (UPF0104 family)